jgi:hypothetical protein
VSLHLALHLDVEDLEGLLSLEGDHFRCWIHDGRVGGDRTTNRVGGVGHVDDDHLIGLADFFSDANEFVRLHREAVEADISCADADIGELAKMEKKKDVLTTGIDYEPDLSVKWG